MEPLLFHQVVKILVLTIILLYASIMDIKTREVEDYIAIMIIVFTVGSLNEGDLTKCIAGSFIVGMPMLIVAILSRVGGLGGADVKLGFAMGFLLGVQRGLVAIVIGLAIGVIVQTVIAIIKKKNFDGGFPMIPYLSIGTLLMYVI